MKNRPSGLVAAVALSLLSACAQNEWMTHQRPTFNTAYIDPSRPIVTVDFGRTVVVRPDPLIFLSNEKDIEIVWKLDDTSAQRFRFAKDDGIVIANGPLAGSRKDPPSPLLPKQEFQCEQRDEGKAFVCINRHNVQGRYKYTVKVTDGSTNKTYEVDPGVMNN